MSPYLNAPTVSTVWDFLALGRERKKKSSSEEVRKGGTRSALFFSAGRGKKFKSFFKEIDNKNLCAADAGWWAAQVRRAGRRRSVLRSLCQVRKVKKRAPNCGRIQHDHPVIYTLAEGSNSLLLLLCVCVFYSTLPYTPLSRMTLVRYRRRPFSAHPLPCPPNPPFWLSTIAKGKQQTKK
jgi:hypothetical protein